MNGPALCLADVAAFGACIRERGHGGKHRDANGYEFGDYARPVRPEAIADPAATLEALGAKWSPDFGAYASGETDASRVRCVLCGLAPCECATRYPFGSAAYFDRLDAMHGRPRQARRTCSAPECPLTAPCGPHPAGLAVAGTGIDSAACISDGAR